MKTACGVLFMKFLRCFSLICIIVLFCTSAQAQPKRVLITAGGDSEFPPFEYIDKNGQPAGFNVDLLNAVAKEAGFEVQYDFGDWNAAKSKLKSGAVDMVLSLAYDKERDNQYDFSIPYIESQYIIFAKSQEMHDVAIDLSGKRVALQKGSIIDEEFSKICPAAEPIRFSRHYDVFDALIKGTADYVIAGKMQGIYFIKYQGMKGIHPVGEPILTVNRCFAVRQGNKELINRLNQGLSIVYENGTYDDLYQKWFSKLQVEEADFSSAGDIALGMIGVFILLFVTIGAWSVILKWKVREKERALLNNEAEKQKIEQQVRSQYLELLKSNQAVSDAYKRLNESSGIINSLETRYSQMFNEMNEGYALHEIIVDNEGKPCDYRFLDANKAFFSMTNFNASALGKTVKEIMPEVEQYWIENYGKIALQGVSMHFENYSKPLNKWFSVSAFSPSKGQFATIFTDVTINKMTEKALMRSEKKYRELYANMLDGFVIMDEEMNILECNQAYATLLGYESPEEIQGVKASFFAREQDQFLEIKELLPQVLQTGVSDLYEKMLVRKDGSKVPVEARLYLIKDENANKAGFWSFVSDITDRKAYEKKLKEINIDLENQVTCRTMELKDSLELLQRTQQELIESEKIASLGKVVAGVAHEINTPVGNALIASSFMQSESDKIGILYADGKLSRDDFEDYIQTCKETSHAVGANLQRAASLISSFKRISTDSIHEEKRKIELGEYFEELAASISHTLRQGGHKLEISHDNDIYCTTFPGVWAQILTNLIDNSLRHGFKLMQGGHIQIDMAQQDDALIIDYIDNGNGITDQVREKIFEPFFTTDHENGSSGLGMNIIYNLIVGKLGGTISCPKVDSGSRFIIKVPLEVAADERIA